MYTSIGPVSVGGIDRHGAPYWSRPCTILHGAERWVFLADASDAVPKIHAYLRNNVTGQFTELDALNAPSVASFINPHLLASPAASVSYIIDPRNPDRVIAAYPRLSDATLTLQVFDMATQLWSTIITGGPQCWGQDFAGVVGDRAASDDSGCKVGMAYRSVDNHLVFNYQGAPELVVRNHARPWFATFDLTGLTWDLNVQLAGAGEQLHYVSNGICVASNGTSHCVVTRPTDGSGTPSEYQIWYLQVEANNTINPKVEMSNDVYRIQEPEVGYPILRTHGATQEILVSYVSNGGGVSANHRACVVRGDIGVAPAFVIETVSTTNENSPIFDSFCTTALVTGDDQNPVLVWNVVSFANSLYSLFVATGGNPGDAWTLQSIYQGQDDINDFQESANVSLLTGIGFAVVEQNMFDTANAILNGTGYFELLAAAPVVVSTGNPRMNMPGAVNLPNPALFCGAEKCDCPEFQSTKGVVGKYQ